MPTLLSINNYYYRRGGAEVVMLEENRMFEEIGWETVPFSMQHENNLPSKWDRFYVSELEYGKNYSVYENIKNATKIIYSYEARNKLKKLLLEVSPDIAHIHNIYHHISPSILSVLKKNNVKTVMTLHDLKMACPAYKMLARDGVCERCKNGKLYNVVAYKCIKNSTMLSMLVMLESYIHRALRIYEKHIDKFIVPSRFYRDKLIEWGMDESRLVYIPNFVDTTQYMPRENDPNNEYIYFGRLSVEKGLQTLIKASIEASVKLKIVGSGPYEVELKKQAVALGGDIEFLGYLSGDQLENVIRSSRAMIIPSEWYENCPMSVMEAYALGVPVIGANIGGIPELIEHGKTGYLFDSGSHQSLSQVLRLMSSTNIKQVKEMGLNALKLVKEKYSKHSYINRLSALYAKLGVVQGISATQNE